MIRPNCLIVLFTIMDTEKAEKYVGLNIYWARREIWISGSLIWSETLIELMFNHYGEFR